MVTDVDGAHFAWREAGRGPVMLLLHGLGGSRLSWEPQLDGLSDRFRVVAWDLPGYGASPPLASDRPVTFAALADAVVAFADELGVGQFHLVGISFGGMIAQYAAARHPDRVETLALLSTSTRFGLDGTTPVAWRAARLAPLDAGLEPADVALDVLRAISGPHITDAALEGQRAAMARVSGAALRRSIDCLVTHDSTAELQRITAPTMCVVGALDAETPPSYANDLAAHIAGATVHVVADTGHLLNVEAPDIVNDLLASHALDADADAPRRSVHP
jgi:3-oxoadipate enol-lactonase